ncbi:MAG TPA: CaiB/BaiF CoA-transferase family protein [Desertimonas sp.]|nr:CaiB/BaiF CoA-transferase family protein [Desertimonas sp.]
MTRNRGPLAGYRIIEIAGIGPGPMAAMLLADLGAEVIRVERAAAAQGPAPDAPHVDITLRGRRNLALDLKQPQGVSVLLDLVDRADALIEGFRPGVMERLGAGPRECLERNPRLVYGRMTGWGQDGPWATAAGHDINYISLAGVLAHCRRDGQPPTPPLNLVGDYGGGAMFLAFGVVCALLEVQRSGEGQVVDAAMVDGAALLMSMFWTLREIGVFDEQHPGTNLLDTGAHFYDVYECADGEYVSIGSIEPQFYAELLQRLGLDGDEQLAAQMDRAAWPRLKQRLAELFITRPRDEWCALLDGTDVCFAPVLTMSEAAVHPHNAARGTFVEVDGRVQPAPAPRFSRTPAAIGTPPAHPGQHSREILADWGLDAGRIETLITAGAVVDA